MIGIVFGAGSSIDLLPDSFFELIDEDNFMSFGVNRIALSKRLKRAEYECDAYVMADSKSPDPYQRSLQEQYIAAIKNTKAKYLYADETHGVDVTKTQLSVWHNSAELAARIAVKEHGCKEIWLIGVEGVGCHCETVPKLDRFQTAWNMVQARGACFTMNEGRPSIWQQVVDECSVPFKVFPHWSLLHPYIVPNAIRIVDNCDEVIFE